MSNIENQPNIVVLILDAVRAKSLSAYGYAQETTPHLDAFAGENMCFRRAFAPASWTIPTHASLLSGLYLSQHRIESVKADRDFNEDIVLLPELLGAHGYETVAFSQNILFDPQYGFSGFQHFYRFDELLRWHRMGRLLDGFAQDARGIRRTAGRYLRKMKGLSLFLRSIGDWIECREQSAPFFLMANITNVHYPWAPPPRTLLQKKFSPSRLFEQDFVTLRPYIFNSGRKAVTESHRRAWRSLYDGALSHVDSEVGRFLERIRQWQGWDNTIVVVTADHGELLGDYRNLVGHMLSLHDNIIHVPLIIRHPAHAKALTVEGVVQNLDLFPSIVEWSGLPTEQIPAAQLQRPPLSAAVADADTPHGFAFAEEDYTDSYDVFTGLSKTNPNFSAQGTYPRRQVVVRSTTHKYIACDTHEEFYDLKDDPDETINLLQEKFAAPPAALLQHKQALENWYSDLTRFPPVQLDTVEEMDGTFLNRLRALGYVA